MLTHYYFAFVIAATGFYAVVRLARRDNRRLALWIALSAAGCLLLFAVHPGTLGAVGRQQQTVPPFEAENVPMRAYRVGTTLLGFAAYPKSLKAALLAALVVGLVAGAVWVARNREKALALYRANAAALIPVYYFAFVGSLMILLYMAFFSHPLAMGASTWRRRGRSARSSRRCCCGCSRGAKRSSRRLFLASLASQSLWAGGRSLGVVAGRRPRGHFRRPCPPSL